MKLEITYKKEGKTFKKVVKVDAGVLIQLFSDKFAKFLDKEGLAIYNEGYITQIKDVD